MSDTAVFESFKGLLSFTITVSIFGASILTVAVSEIADPATISANAAFSKQEVRVFLSISWLLFVLSLGVVAVSMSVLAFQQEHAGTHANQDSLRTLKPWGLLASSIIQILIIVAFLFLSLVVAAYTGAVGWVAVASTAVVAILAMAKLALEWS